MMIRYAAAALAALSLAGGASAASIVLKNVDPPGVGFNDPTPATPVGGNAGTTVGQQRLIAYQRALELWGKTLSSNVPIVVRGSFARLSCSATGGTLAQAGAVQVFSDFPGAPLANHWYGAALANALAGSDLAPGPVDGAPSVADDIVANFNGDIGKPDCIAGPGWYYGLDSNPGPGQTDFLDVFMHEVAHGLGFQNFVNEATGNNLAGRTDVYSAFTYDLTQRLAWNQMLPAQIRASAVNNGKVVWTGAKVNASAPLVLGPYEGVRVFGGLSRELTYGAASFGAAPSAATLNGSIVIGNDGVAAAGGGTATDGCEPFPVSLAGKVVLIDRGLCGFVTKVKNAQNAGAKAVILANTLGRADFEPGGSDASITIAAIGISQADGDAIRAALATTAVGVEYFQDPSRLAGVAEGWVRLYAPTVVALGSSISHFDTTAAPNLLMEPFATSTLRGAFTLDLTPALMQDIGWKIETLKIAGCDTGVPSVLPTGEMLHAQVDTCRVGARNHGQFVSCMARVTNRAKDRGFFTDSQSGAVMSCAARAN